MKKVGIVVLLIILFAVFTEGCSTPKTPPPTIKADEVDNYIGTGRTVAMNLTLIEEVREDSNLDGFFLMFVIPAGKIMVPVSEPITDFYNVYRTSEERVMVGIRKSTNAPVPLNQPVIIMGKIMANRGKNFVVLIVNDDVIIKQQ